MTMKKNETPSFTCMAHVQKGNAHGVAAQLHVLITESIDGGFVAQGIEIDYAATGETEEAARDHFAKGFVATVRAYLRRGRDLSGLFKSEPPAEFRQAYFNSANQSVFQCALGHKGQDELPAGVPQVLNFIRTPAHAHA